MDMREYAEKTSRDRQQSAIYRIEDHTGDRVGGYTIHRANGDWVRYPTRDAAEEAIRRLRAYGIDEMDLDWQSI
jgi:hypothetical protein